MTTQPELSDILELVSQHSDDPSGAVYDELYRRHPDLKSLFGLDTDGSVRGSMFEQCIECLLDYEDDGSTHHVILSVEHANHDGYGVPDDIFREFFDCMGVVFAGLVGETWTEAHSHAWKTHVDAMLRQSIGDQAET